MKRWVLVAALASGCGHDNGLLEARSVEAVLAPAIRYEATPVHGIVRHRGRPLANALVLIERDGEDRPHRTPVRHELVIEKDRKVVPHVVIGTGDTIEIRNNDQQHMVRVGHQALYVPHGKRASFTPKPGLSKIWCDAHGDFFTVLTIDPELQTKTDEHGRFEFPQVESGWVRVVVWAGVRRYKARRVQVGVARATELTFNTP